MVEVEHRNYLLENPDLKKKKKNPKDTYIVPIQSLKF